MKDHIFNDNIIYQVSSFAHHFTRLLTTSFQQQAIPITAEQFSILMLLAGEDGIGQNDISKRLERDKTTVTRVLINLNKQGLIRRKGDASDARAKKVSLTTRGKKVQVKALQVAAALYSRAVGNASNREIDQAVSLLQKMNQAIKSN